MQENTYARLLHLDVRLDAVPSISTLANDIAQGLMQGSSAKAVREGEENR
jgi:hypothetical protein